MKPYLRLSDFSQKVDYRIEIFAGLTVAMTMIPESLSFAILGGFPPLAGLYAAFIMGLFTAVFGGRPGMVSGGAGATVVVLIAWESAKRINVKKYAGIDGVMHYEVIGPLFFGSVANFKDKFDISSDPEDIIIDFKHSRIADMSAIDALNKLTERYLITGKNLHLIHLSEDCKRLLNDADKIIEVNILEDPTYLIAVDNVKKY